MPTRASAACADSGGSSDTKATDRCGDSLEKPLADAVRSGDVDAVRDLLEHGASLNVKNKYGKCLVHVAASRCDAPVLELLLAGGAHIDELDTDGKTPLFCEAECGAYEAVALLLTHDAAVDARSPTSATPLIAAAARGHERIVTQLLDAGADVNATDLQQRTPLCAAAKSGHMPCLRLLVDLGAVTDTEQFGGRSPLLLATSNGHEDVVAYLIEINADVVNDTDSNGYTALHVAAGNGRVAITALLLAKNAPVDAKGAQDGATPLHLAAQRGLMDVAKLLAEKRASVDVKQANGKTPLHLAVEHGFVDVVQMLIRARASAAVQDNSGHSPLSVAVATNCVEIVKLLLAHGAPVNKKDAQGTTPLMEAVKHGRLELAKLLVKSGAAVEEMQRYGRSALMLALSHREQRTVQWLLKDCSASVTTVDNAGWSPLHVAVASRQPSMVNLLLYHGARIDVTNRDGKTPLDLAVEKGFGEEFELLRTRGGGDSRRLDTTLLFMTAAKFGRVGLMNMLRQKGVMLHRESVGESGVDPDGNTTALLSLARWGRVGFFKLLFSSCIARVSDAQSASNGSAELLRDTLKAIRGLCADIEESEHMYSNVAARLADVGAAGMAALRESTDSRRMLGDIVYRFCRQLLQCRKRSTVTRFLESHTTNSSLRDFHGEIDSLQQRLGLDSARKESEQQPSWRSVWLSDQETQAARYRAALERDTQEGALQDVDQVEAMTNLQYMVTRRGRREAVDVAIAESVIEQLKSSGAAVPDVPAWFLSRYNIAFEDWSRVKASTFAKGTLLNASVTILKSDLDAVQFSQIATAWKQISHQNVVDLFGACHVGTPRFFVCDSLRDECLKPYLNRQHNQLLALTKLDEAAQGLLFLHEHGVVHGNLTSDRIMIGDDGRAKIGGFEQGVLGLTDQSVCVDNASVEWVSPEVRRGELPTVKSDVFSFGVCILDVLTMTEPWRVRSGEPFRHYLLRSSSAPPPGIPNRKLWVLIKEMCAPVSTQRVTLSYVIGMFPYFIEEAEDDARSKASSGSGRVKIGKLGSAQGTDLISWREPGTTRSIPETLALLLNQCTVFPETVELAQHIHSRLTDVFDILVREKLTSADRIVVQFVDILDGFRRYLKPGAQAHSHTIRARSQKIAFCHEVYHKKIDTLLDLLRVAESDKIREWEAKHQDEVAKLSRIACGEETGNSLVVTVRSIKSLKRDPSDLLPAVSVKSALSDDRQWFIDLSDIEFNKDKDRIAVGGFGEIFRGTWRRGTPVVIKSITDANTSQQLFLHEIKVWYPLKHTHVIRLWGAFDGGKRYFVCEDATNGTLIEYLKAHAVTLSAKKLRNLAWELLHQSALGLQYCHDRNVVHNDLKCDNILVGADGKAKLSDFGLSSMPGVADLTFKKVERMGAVDWKAPEYFKGGKPSFESDIYSFAMCIVEAMRIVDPDTRLQLKPWGQLVDAVVKNYVRKGHRPKAPASMSESEWELVVRMTETDPLLRVSIASVVGRLQVIIAEESADSRDTTEL